MSNSSSIPAGLPILGSGDSTAPSRHNTPVPSSASPAAKPVQLFVNPSFRFDPSVGLVVIQFHNDTGIVENSIPSERQLAAYRSHRETPPGERAPEASGTVGTHPRDAKTSAG